MYHGVWYYIMCKMHRTLFGCRVKRFHLNKFDDDIIVHIDKLKEIFWFEPQRCVRNMNIDACMHNTEEKKLNQTQWQKRPKTSAGT